MKRTTPPSANTLPVRKKLSPRTIALLDVARAGAAIYVVLYHVAVDRGWTGGSGFALRFGQEAVMIFFLLSGFVIFANERDRATDGFGYFFRRIRRIYPALLIAMLVSAIVAGLNGTLMTDFSMAELLGTLFAAQDIATLKPGVIVDPFLRNAPLWTLSYEIVFYLIFPLTLLAWRRFATATTFAIGTIGCLSYLSFALIPNHWTLIVSYYVVWWTGAMAADAYLNGKRTVASLAAPLLCLGALSAVAAGVVLAEGHRGIGVFPFLQFRHFIVSLIAVITVFGPLGALLSRFSLRFARPAAALASISYGLYVLHFPLLVQASWVGSLQSLAGMSVILVMLSWFADRYLNDHLPRWKSRHGARATKEKTASTVRPA